MAKGSPLRALVAGLFCLAALHAPARAAESDALPAPAEQLPEPVARVATALGVPADAISLWVAELDADRPLVSWRARVARSPASTMKLVTTFAALEGLTPAYRWRTEVFALGPIRDGVLSGDLLLRGFGDPFLVAEEFWKLVGAIRATGLREIRGDLVFDTGAFVPDEQPRSAFDGQPDRIYNLPPHPLLVNFNAMRFEFAPDPVAGRVRVAVEPALANVEVVNRLGLVDGPCEGYQRGVALNVVDAVRRERVLLEGRFPTGCQRYGMTRSVLTPEAYAWGLFGLYWNQLGGRLDGGWRLGTLPADLIPEDPETGIPMPEESDALVTVHRSRPLGDVVRLVNKYSNNVMTRQLYLTLGGERFGLPADRDKGQRALVEILARNGVETTGLVIDNPSGLTRDGRISAEQLGRLLQAAWRSPYMPEFVSSLALSGLDGTVSDRFMDMPQAGRMHLKTGTLDDVSAIAGYVQTRTDRRRVVVVLVNAPRAHRGPGEEIQDALLDWVYRD
ncbi:MAG: D-alanyl-D-alanine carboxypeptidase/D-alanyl-D-alanine-endopeptidase [Pseudomonadales bacterium]|jgi:D-alanyl-D-alanine carboxypeptidase/D-alanyl-D-alanine-endopeptidase (penicillin-binding protein 4)|nr:D-alanyl-D-alanine carboxypeptidase/D-alanyl-D-alanine-endopeptidase [Pseudomonadales bacterium]